MYAIRSYYVCFTFQPNQFDHLVHTLVDIRLWSGIEELGGVFQHLAGGHVLVKPGILRQVTDFGADINAITDDVLV